MKDIKSVFEKMGLVEKVQIPAVEEGQLTGAEIHELHTGMAGAKENTRDKREYSGISPGGIEKRRLLKAGEIYDNFNINSKGTNSLFIIESYLKALPDYLPNDVKRDSILNIITSSGMDISNLLADGREKLKCLKGFSQTFSQEVKDTVKLYESEIRKLSEVISDYNKVIEDIKSLEEEQGAVIDYETDKINNIMQFMAPES